MNLQNFLKISDYEWVIEKKFRKGMRVPVKFFGSEELLSNALRDKSFEQAINASFLPGLEGFFCIMPDVHQGYGFPIGGVAAVDINSGVVSPGGIGYDINCGVRLLSSKISIEVALPYLEKLSLMIYQKCPSGVGKKSTIHSSDKDFRQMCLYGSKWALERGYAIPSDLEFSEDQGCISGADISTVSNRALERGMFQSGSLGSGNHFIEIDLVDEIIDEESARVMGLSKDYLAIQIHTGSRGFGHQICTDYVREFQTIVNKYQISIPDRELVCAPIQSKEGKRYLAAMRCASNFAFCNRQLLTSIVRQIFEEVFNRVENDCQLITVYDLAHNIGKMEKHFFGGKEIEVCVHRKGATRAYGPGHPEVPEKYRKIGQPVLIPGSMGTASWVMAGTESAMKKSIGSCCHGAGRMMSRAQAKKSIKGDLLFHQLQRTGIFVQTGSKADLAEEAPNAYKNVDSVVESATRGGLAKKIAKLKPIVVIKG